MLTLTLKNAPTVPLEAEAVSPDRMAALSLAEIAAMPVFHGKRTLRLDDFFTVEGEPSDTIELRGNLTKVRWIGRGMTHGRIRIVGNIGMHLGAYMKGGTIEVQGHATDWVGGEMAGGRIHVHGNVGGQVGAAYRGSVSGMSGGTLLVEGTAGIELGMRMKRGLIVVKGKVRDFAGLQMKGGTIVLMGGAEIRTGAWMSRGTIISLEPLRVMPTFAETCLYEPSFLPIYAKHLHPFGFHLPIGNYRKYLGDLSVPGQGELLVWNNA